MPPKVPQLNNIDKDIKNSILKFLGLKSVVSLFDTSKVWRKYLSPIFKNNPLGPFSFHNPFRTEFFISSSLDDVKPAEDGIYIAPYNKDTPSRINYTCKRSGKRLTGSIDIPPHEERPYPFREFAWRILISNNLHRISDGTKRPTREVQECYLSTDRSKTALRNFLQEASTIDQNTFPNELKEKYPSYSLPFALYLYLKNDYQARRDDLFIQFFKGNPELAYLACQLEEIHSRPSAINLPKDANPYEGWLFFLGMFSFYALAGEAIFITALALEVTMPPVAIFFAVIGALLIFDTLIILHLYCSFEKIKIDSIPNIAQEYEKSLNPPRPSLMARWCGHFRTKANDNPMQQETAQESRHDEVEPNPVI